MNSPIGDNGLAPIEGFTRLERLGLAQTRLTDSGTKHLSTLSNLVELDLQQPSIGDSGVRPLFDLPRLWNLNLVNTSVTDAGLLSLVDRINSSQCKSLMLSRPYIAPPTLGKLRRKLPHLWVVGPRGMVAPEPRPAPQRSLADQEMPQ